MKKILPIIIIVIILGAAGVFYFTRNKQGVEPVVSRVTEGLTVKENNSLFGWLKRGKSVECVLSTAEGSMTVSTKNENVRVDGLPYAFGEDADNPQPGTSLTTGEWVYFWSGNEGIKFNLTSMDYPEASEEETVTDKSDFNWEDWVSDMEAEDVSYDCREKSLSNDLFTPPSEVKFTDWTEMVTEMQAATQEALKGVQQEGLEEFDAEEMQKKLDEMDFEQLMKDAGVETE